MENIPFSNSYKNIKEFNVVPAYDKISCISFIKGETNIKQDDSHKSKIANRFHSVKTTSVKVKYCNMEPTYEDLALVLFSIADIGKTEQTTPRVCNCSDNKEVEMSDNLYLFLKQLPLTKKICVNVLVGKSHTPFRFSVEKDKDYISVTTRIYHPENLSSENVLDLLRTKISSKMREYNILREILKK